MIKFFRQIRQNLIMENKTSKYLKYALGEIFLVVIGILIALSINNWNEGRKNLKKEQEILIQLKEEYESNLTQLEEKMAQRSLIVQSSKKLLTVIDQNNTIHLDSLILKFTDIFRDPTFDPIKNDLITSGNIRLIQNKELKRHLSNWSSDVVALLEIEAIWSSHVNKMVLPFGTKIGLTRNVVNSWWDSQELLTWLLEQNTTTSITNIGKTRKPIDVNKILENQELEGILAAAFSWNQSGNLQSVALRNKILEILDLLNQEIKVK